MGFFGKYQATPVTLDDGELGRVLLDSVGRVQITDTGEHETVGYESLTVSSTAVSPASIPATAIRAIITVEDDNVRFRTDGTAPTASVGHRLLVNDALVLESAADIAAFQVIRETTDAVLRITYQS